MYDHRYHDYSTSGYWTPGVKFLIIANLIVFGVEVLCQVISPKAYQTLILYLGLGPAQVIEKFWIWQLITCAFLHDVGSIFHLFFNMLTLFFFGHIVEMYYGTRRFLLFYFLSAIFASIGYCVIHYFVLHQGYFAIGASGAIMSVLVMSACLVPQAVVYLYFIFPLRLRTLIWFLVGLDLYMALLNPHGGVAATGHLSGALFGYLFYCFDRRMFPIPAWMKSAYSHIHKWIIQWWRDLSKATPSHPSSQDDIHSATQNDDDSYEAAKTRAEVDRLLDKVNNEGISSLTPKERAFLYRASQVYRQKMDDE